jgi:hypothetical protein
MRKRKWQLALAGLMLALLAVGAFVAWSMRDRVSEENFKRVFAGMSRADAESILGPPGDYRSGPTKQQTGLAEEDVLGSFLDQWRLPADDGKLLSWAGDAGMIYVVVGGGIVKATVFLPEERVPQSFLDNLQWRISRFRGAMFPEAEEAPHFDGRRGSFLTHPPPRR